MKITALLEAMDASVSTIDICGDVFYKTAGGSYTVSTQSINTTYITTLRPVL
jgi:hypothetical protein